MGVFEFFVGRKKQTPGEMAKERLKVVLVHDRLKVSPEVLEMIKAELLSAISRRLDVDEQNMQISLARESGWDTIQANVPIKRQKVSFEWDPPAHPGANANVMHGRLHLNDNE